MTVHHAACSRGQLWLVAHGDPIRISMCHCLACQRRTGSTFGAQARFPREHVRIGGESTEHVRIGGESTEYVRVGDAAHFHFCPRCGATVYCWTDDGRAIAVPIGALADPAFPPPRVSVRAARRHPWVSVRGAERRD